MSIVKVGYGVPRRISADDNKRSHSTHKSASNSEPSRRRWGKALWIRADSPLPKNAESLVLSPREVQSYLGISDRLLYKLLKSGDIRGERLRGQWFISKFAFFERFGWPPSEKRQVSLTEPALPTPNNDSAHEIAAPNHEAVKKQHLQELMTPNQVEEHYGIFAGRIRDACKLWHAGDRVNGLQNFLDKKRFKIRSGWIDEWLERCSGGPTGHAA